MPTERELEALYARYESGENLATVARGAFVHESTLWRWFTSRGYALRSRGSRLPRLHGARLAPLAARHRAGETLREIAADLPVSASTLCRALRRWRVEAAS